MTLSLINKRFRHMLIAAIAVSGIALSILISLSNYAKDEKSRQVQFNHAVENRYFALRREIDNNLAVLESVQALYLSTQDVERSELMDRDEFRDFANQILQHNASIQALEWIPRVPDSERQSYESAARRDGFPDFQFTERLPQGKLKRAEQRKEYFPIYFVEPSLSNAPYLGFNLASDTASWTAMERAARSGEILAAGRITLPGEGENQFGFTVFAPVYRKGVLTDTDQVRLDNLEGFMLSEFRIGKIVEDAIALLEPEGIDFSITDASASDEDSFLYSHESRLNKTPRVKKEQSEVGFRKTKMLGFAGRKWIINFSAAPDFIAARGKFDHWELSLAGFAVTGLLAGFLLFSGRHAEQIEKSARELASSNAMLTQEMKEHQQAEDQLREKERLLSESQRLGHVGSFFIDATGLMQWSDELCRLFGASPATFTLNMESLLSLIHPEDKPSMQAWVDDCMTGKKPSALEFRVIFPDGTIHFIRGNGEAVFDDMNRFLYLAGLGQDVTERKNAEEENRKQQELTTKIIETIPLRVFWKDRDLRFQGCNTLFAKDAGLTSPEELIGKTDFEMVWKDQAEFYRADDQQVMNDNIPKLSYDEPQTTPEGKQLWLRSSKVPLLNDRNETIGILGLYEDITTYKQAAQALEESERRFRAILDATVDGIVQVDVQTRVLHGGNKAICGMLGYSMDELPGLCFEDLHPAETRLEVQRQFERHVKGEIHLAPDLPVQRKDGSVFFADISTALMEFAGRTFIVGIFHDVTERKQAEEQIRSLNEGLEAKVLERTQQLLAAQEDLVRKEKLALLGQVAGSVGHELRNPLAVMNNAVYFLQTVLADADETTLEYLAILKVEIDDADRIVADLLDSVRTKSPRPTAESVGELIDRIMGKYSVPDTIIVTLDIPETLPPVWVDGRQIQQVFSNLISNAVEAMLEGGTLAIRAVENRSEGAVIVSVSDSGSGIVPEMLAKLFQPLVTTKARGIGLGLVVIKNLTEANGGTVTVESEVGRGTTFAVTLPTGISTDKVV